MVRGRRARTVLAHLAVLGVLGLVWLPSEHVHEIDEHGEHSEVVHRHFAPHHADGSNAHVDHAEGDARYLSSPFAPERISSPSGPDVLAVVDLVLPEPSSALGQIATSRHERVHDPPWASAPPLRGPPSLHV